jgi:hypothetical protein
MNGLKVTNVGLDDLKEAAISSMGVDNIIEYLRPYGLLNIHQHKDGWSANIELFMPGVEATVRSGFQHPSLRSALLELMDRANKVIK